MEQERVQIVRNEEEEEKEEVALIRFLGIARWDDEDDTFALIGFNDTTEQGIGKVAQEVLHQLTDRVRNGEEPGAAAEFETVNGYWFVKQLPDQYAYMISTAKDYPAYAAVECLDELSEAFQHAREQRSSSSERKSPTQCCLDVLEKYDSLQQGSVSWRLGNEIEHDVTNPYDEKVKAMMQRVESIKGRLNASILQQLENMEHAEDLQSKADDLLMQAAVFKKQAAKLPKKTFFQKKSVWVTAAGALVGAGIGVAAGGVGAPALVPASVAFAEGMEMVMVGAGCAVASHIAYRSTKARWFASQKLIRLNMARIVD